MFIIYGYGLTFNALNLDKSKIVLCVKQIHVFRKEQFYSNVRTMNKIHAVSCLMPGIYKYMVGCLQNE